MIHSKQMAHLAHLVHLVHVHSLAKPTASIAATGSSHVTEVAVMVPAFGRNQLLCEIKDLYSRHVDRHWDRDGDGDLMHPGVTRASVTLAACAGDNDLMSSLLSSLHFTYAGREDQDGHTD